MIKKLNFLPLIKYYSHLYQLEPNYNLKNKIKQMLLSDWNININKSSEIISFQSLSRDDYNNFINIILSSIKPINTQHILIKRIKRFDIKVLICTFLHSVYVYRNLKYISNKREKLYLLISILDILKIIQKLKNTNPKFVIAHADMQASENIIIQYYNIQNIDTITLQHGLYIDYSTHANINEVNYANVVSKYFLAWGEETKNLIQKYHPKCNIHILGNPQIPQKKREEKRFFVIIFEQELFKEYNYQLLNIGREVESFFNIKLKVKFHPRNIFKDYTIDRSEVIKFDEVYNAKFAIGHTSTMMYQMMRNNIPVFKLISTVPSNIIAEKLTFNNFESLKELILNCHTINYKKEGEFYIKYIAYKSLKKYESFFKELYEKD